MGTYSLVVREGVAVENEIFRPISSSQFSYVHAAIILKAKGKAIPVTGRRGQ
jgi:hypothetical protein